MAGEYTLQRSGKSRGIQRAIEVESEAFVERTGFFVAQLRGQTNFHLRLGEWALKRSGQTARGCGQQATALHIRDAVTKRSDDLIQVLRSVGRGQKAGKAFQNMYAAQPHMGIKQRRETLLGGEGEIEQRSEMLALDGERRIGKHLI